MKEKTQCKFIELPNVKEYVAQGYGLYFGYIADSDDICLMFRKKNEFLLYNIKSHEWFPVGCDVHAEYRGNDRIDN